MDVPCDGCHDRSGGRRDHSADQRYGDRLLQYHGTDKADRESAYERDLAYRGIPVHQQYYDEGCAAGRG